MDEKTRLCAILAYDEGHDVPDIAKILKIECYHLELKPVCNIERFQVRKSHSIRTHIHCALRAFCKLKIKTVNYKFILNTSPVI